MKQTINLLAALVLAFLLSCTKEPALPGTGASPAAAGAGKPGPIGHASARYSGSGYSQSIPVDTANRMLSSYFGSIGYPGTDTALCSLSFDADTLRAYLQNHNIVTLKFMVAHQQGYINGGYNGVAAGMRPDALTLIVVGLNNNDQYVLNNRNKVYDYMYNCPYACYANNGALIQ